jgi:hypothetical protein
LFKRFRRRPPRLRRRRSLDECNCRPPRRTLAERANRTSSKGDDMASIDDEYTRISRANHIIDSLLGLNNEFLKHAAAHGSRPGTHVPLEVTDKGLRVASFGFAAEAFPRLVRTPSGGYAMEYAFFVTCGDDLTEVSRFYLAGGGRLVESVLPAEGTANVTICDHNNSNIAMILTCRVMVGLLDSPVLAPRQKAS